MTGKALLYSSLALVGAAALYSFLAPKEKNGITYYTSIRLSGLYSAQVEGASFTVGRYRISVEDYNDNGSWDMVKVEKKNGRASLYTLYLYDRGGDVKVVLEAFGEKQEWTAEKDSALTRTLDRILQKKEVERDKLREVVKRLRKITKEADLRAADIVKR